MAIIKNLKTMNSDKDWGAEEGTPPHSFWERKLVQLLWKFLKN